MLTTGPLHTELELYRLGRTRSRDQVYLAIGRISPATPLQIVGELAGKVSRRTVYRTIRTFINAQVVRELPGNLVELNPPFRPKGYTIVCRGCDRRVNFWDPKLEALLDKFIAQRRFVFPGHQVQLSGLCEVCADPAWLQKPKKR